MRVHDTTGIIPASRVWRGGSELQQVGAGLHEAFKTTLQSCPLAADVHILLQQELQIVLVMEHLQHLPLQLDSRLLQHLVADHQWDLVSQTLAGDLKVERVTRTYC